MQLLLNPRKACTACNPRLSDDHSHCFPHCALIPVYKFAHRPDHKTFFNRGNDRLDRRRLEQPGLLPMRHDDFTEAARRPELTCYRHDDEIWSLGVVGLGADNDGGAFLGGELIGNWKRR